MERWNGGTLRLIPSYGANNGIRYDVLEVSSGEGREKSKVYMNSVPLENMYTLWAECCED